MAIRLKDGLVEIFANVVTTSATTGPLEDDGEIRVGSGDVDDLANAVYRTGLEGDVADARASEAVNDLIRLLSAGNAGGDTETFDRKSLLPHLLPQRELETELALIDVERVEGDTDTIGDLLLDFGNFGTESLCVVVSTTSQLDVVPSIEDCADEASLDGGGGHTSDHDGGLAEETREWGVEEEFALTIRLGQQTPR